MIKVCGIRSVEEANELKDLDVDYFGLIFAKSKREVSIEKAKEIASIFKSSGKKVVGVFVEKSRFLDTKDKIDLDVYQLHGDFSYEFCKSLLDSNKEIWRVFRVSDTLPDFKDFKTLFQKRNFYPLFDTLGKNMGGNGEAFNHDILSTLEPQSFIIAGGLGSENCLHVSKLNPYVLDFNSKLETNDKKDRKKVEEIVKLLKKTSN